VMHEKWRIVGVESVRKRRIVEVRVQPVWWFATHWSTCVSVDNEVIIPDEMC
jgi:hypothetical protein